MNALNRGQARAVLSRWYREGPSPTTIPKVLDALEKSVVDDQRVARIAAWAEDVDDGGPVFLDRLHAILRDEA